MHLLIASVLVLGFVAMLGLGVLLCLDWIETAEDVHVPLVMTGETARRMNAGELYVVHSVAEVPRSQGEVQS